MPITAPRDLKIGAIVEESLGVLERNIVPAVIFMVVLGALNAATTYFGQPYSAPLQQLAKGGISMIIGIVAAYVFLEALLKRAGYRSPDADDAFLPYFGLSILYTLGVMVGLVLIIFPGLFLIARWSVAQPLLVVRGRGVIQSMKDSWELTKGNEFSILVAILLLLFIPLGISIGAGIMFEQSDPVGIVVGQVASAASTTVSIALGVALYGMVFSGRGEAAAFS